MLTIQESESDSDFEDLPLITDYRNRAKRVKRKTVSVNMLNIVFKWLTLYDIAYLCRTCQILILVVNLM